MLHFVGVQRELEALFDRFDADLDGVISYQEFASGVVGLGPSAAVCTSTPPSAIAAVRDKILAAGGKNGVRSLGVILRRMDQNGNGALELEVSAEVLPSDAPSEACDLLMHNLLAGVPRWNGAARRARR
jgi:Ca2+-binding EF-hand superfamily protein